MWKQGLLVHRNFNRAAAFVVLLAVALTGSLAEATGRVALVIGNSAYQYVAPLRNPVNDAADMTQTLADLGFDVISAEDADHAQMMSAIGEFDAKAQTSTVALFYFAGHGFQVGRKNFITPVDLQVSDETSDAVNASISLDLVSKALNSAPGLRIVVLDSCRDNPLGVSLGAVDQGLAPESTDANYMYVFATQPDAVAEDGDGRNGTFTEALLNHIRTPGQTLSELMINVRRDVVAATGGQQIPWENSSITETFHFVEGMRTASTEASLFQIASRLRSPDLMAFYADRYPGGTHIRSAAGFIRNGFPPTNVPSNLAAEEDRLWDLALRMRQRRLMEVFLDLYPEGPYVQQAQAYIEELPELVQMGVGQRCERLATHPNDTTASTPGVPFSQLEGDPFEAILICNRAVEAFPDQPRFKALLARAIFASGETSSGMTLYEDAAENGDLRALWTLGVIHERGVGVDADEALAIEYFTRAAEGGSADGMVDLAVKLIESDGSLIERDVERGLALFQQAADLGSAQATFNLGFMALENLGGGLVEAYEYFVQAARSGEPRGYRQAAMLLDRGVGGIERNTELAASHLLRSAAEDGGQTQKGFIDQDFNWSPDTIRAVQTRLAEVGLYRAGIDGVVGANFHRALDEWRQGGFDASVLLDG